MALFFIAIFIYVCTYTTVAASPVQTTPNYHDEWCESNCSSLAECDEKYGQDHVDLQIQVRFPIDDGPGRHLVFGKYFGNTINRQTFETQFIFDIATSLDTSPCRIYVIAVFPNRNDAYWDSENVFVKFRLFPLDADAVTSLTKQIQVPDSRMYQGKITHATDDLYGLVALKWDFSLKITYSISIVGGSDVIEPQEHESYLNQGSFQSCSKDENADSLYCIFESHLIQDMEQSLGLPSGRFVVLFMKESGKNAVVVSFRLVPDTSLLGSSKSTSVVDWIQSVVTNFLDQMSDYESPLYKGNLTFRIDPTWGVSGESKQLLQSAKFLSRPIPPTSDDSYERCKATHRCPRAWSNYNQMTTQISHTIQQFNGGKHTDVALFTGFEDWRRGIRSWKQSCRNNVGDQCLPETGSERESNKPLGAHFSPFDFESLGQSIPTYGHLFNSGLILNQKELKKDLTKQQLLIDKYESLVKWLDREYIHAVTADANLRSREEIRANITDYTAFISNQKELLQTLSTSQCAVNCTLLFNTSNAEMSGAVNATGVITTTANGTEVVVWPFNSIDIDENVYITLTGQRAMVLLSRSSVRLNTTVTAIPGTLGGFPGGFSVARRPEDRLSRVCVNEVDTREFLDKCKGKSCCPGDQPISELVRGIRSNNVNGPGSPSSRVYLFTIQTSAPVVHEVMHLKTSADVGQTLSGGFRLHFNNFSTPFLPHDISAGALKAKMENSLNPSPRLKTVDRSHTPVGIGIVEVTRERLGTSGGFHWSITFTSSVGTLSKDSGRISVTSELVSKGARATIATVIYGNSIGGAFALQFLGNTTRQISHDVSAADLRNVLLNDISSLNTVDVLRNDAVANCNDGFCYNGPDQSGGYIWTLSITTDVGNISPSSPTSNAFDTEGRVEDMIALNYLTGCVDSQCPQVKIKNGHAKSHNKEMRSIITDKPFSLAYGAAGAGYGESGGRGFHDIAQGKSYGDNELSDLLGGSGGAVGANRPFQLAMFKGPRGRGGSGGGAIEIVAANDIILESNAILSFDGESGADAYMFAGGGGSGGSILLAAGGSVHVKGKLSAMGGSGGRMKAKPNLAIDGGHGGGGSGGRIALYGESVVIENESFISLDGGSCSNVSSANNCTGGEGSLFIRASLDTMLSLDHMVGAEGTSSSLYLHPRKTRPPYNAPLTLTQSGPEYDLGRTMQPGRVLFYVRVANSTNGGWDAMIELRESRWSYIASKEIVDYTAVIGLAVGSEIRHGANYIGVPFTDEHVNSLTSIYSGVDSNTWTKVDIRFDWKKKEHDLYLNNTRIVMNMPFRGDGIRAISISNFFEGSGVWLDEVFVGADTTMGFHCPVVLADGSVEMERPPEKGWKANEVGNESSTLSMQRHQSHISKRALYQRDKDLFVAPYDGDEKTLFNSDIKFRTDHGDRELKPGKFHAGSVLKIPRGDDFEKVFLSNRRGSNLDTYFWYGEHNYDNDPMLSSGAVMACSTQDFKSWKFEGAMLHYDNITDMVHGFSSSLHIEKPKVLFNEITQKYVMWMILDNGTRDLGLAGVAVSDEPNGPFTFVRSFYPDGNQTRDQTLYQDEDGSAYLFRTFYQTVDYAMPRAVMQPTWESVKNADGSINFALSHHRAEYNPGYDDYHDIYLQRWRKEDKPWKVVCINRLTKEEREVPYGREHLNFDGEVCHNPFEYKVVLGQGNPMFENSKNGIQSRFLDPYDPANNAWMPNSVPNEKGQTWNNTIHPTLPDKRVGPQQTTMQRRAKYVAVSRLTDDMLGLSGIVNVYEGGLEEGADLLSIVRQYFVTDNAFGWTADHEIRSVYQSPIHDTYFEQEKNQGSTLHQYETQLNDASQYSPSCVYDGNCPTNFPSA